LRARNIGDSLSVGHQKIPRSYADRPKIVKSSGHRSWLINQLLLRSALLRETLAPPLVRRSLVKWRDEAPFHRRNYRNRLSLCRAVGCRGRGWEPGGRGREGGRGGDEISEAPRAKAGPRDILFSWSRRPSSKITRCPSSPCPFAGSSSSFFLQLHFLAAPDGNLDLSRLSSPLPDAFQQMALFTRPSSG
jgi:hypothetical protein